MVETQEKSGIIELDELFGDKRFLKIGGQILFKKDGRYVATRFSSQQNYTAKDYMELPEGAPFQLIQSKLIFMPSPTYLHQKISMLLGNQLFNHVDSKSLGEVCAAPMDVHFDENNIYQPDLLFIRKERLHIIDKFVYGAPDLVVEILSKATEAKDKNDKKEIYAQYGVQEYWVINPENETLEVFSLENQELQSQGVLTKKDTLKVMTMKGFELDLRLIFS